MLLVEALRRIENLCRPPDFRAYDAMLWTFHLQIESRLFRVSRKNSRNSGQKRGTARPSRF
jgi:hypothetical protein